MKYLCTDCKIKFSLLFYLKRILILKKKLFSPSTDLALYLGLVIHSFVSRHLIFYWSFNPYFEKLNK